MAVSQGGTARSPRYLVASVLVGGESVRRILKIYFRKPTPFVGASITKENAIRNMLGSKGREVEWLVS